MFASSLSSTVSNGRKLILLNLFSTHKYTHRLGRGFYLKTKTKAYDRSQRQRVCKIPLPLSLLITHLTSLRGTTSSINPPHGTVGPFIGLYGGFDFCLGSVHSSSSPCPGYVSWKLFFPVPPNRWFRKSVRDLFTTTTTTTNARGYGLRVSQE